MAKVRVRATATEVWVLQTKTKKQKNWHPMDVFAARKGAEIAEGFNKAMYPKLMFRVRPFRDAGRGE